MTSGHEINSIETKLKKSGPHIWSDFLNERCIQNFGSDYLVLLEDIEDLDG